MDSAAADNQVSIDPNTINGKRKAYNTEDGQTLDAKRKKLTIVQAETVPEAANISTPVAVAPQSPRKRLQLLHASKDNKKPGLPQSTHKTQFIYGNYHQYYGYRNKGKDHHDIRLDMFAQHAEFFKNADVLDIGCNNGLVTMEVAKRFDVKSITGLDIDKVLINQATKSLVRQKKALPLDNEARRKHRYPYNVNFVHGNYVLRDDVLLEIEYARYDVILCLSLTKWIQLNFGDAGLKQAFRRMFLQLRSGGKLILEAQPYDNYGRRKKMTESIYTNYKAIQFYPKQFEEYLLSAEVGFSNVEFLGVPEHCVVGFKRPIQVFTKN